MNLMKLGVFDSGIGGEAVAASLGQAFPDADVTVVNDREHVPYGDRSPEEIIRLTDAAIQPLLGCDIIILACNSATAAAIETLRSRYPEQHFIGLEPMVKPAAGMTQSGVIAICATPATLSSDRYRTLKRQFGSGTTILEPDCSDWARLIEDNSLNASHVADVIDSVCSEGADVIVLACTHYHWIRTVIEKSAAGRAAVIDPSAAIVQRVRSLLERR